MLFFMFIVYQAFEGLTLSDYALTRGQIQDRWHENQRAKVVL